MSTVRTNDVVQRTEMFTNTNRNRLLTGVQVREARNLAGLDLNVQALFKISDRAHLPISLEQAVSG